MFLASSVAFLISKSNYIVSPDGTFWCIRAPNESCFICDNEQKIIIRSSIIIEFSGGRGHILPLQSAYSSRIIGVEHESPVGFWLAMNFEIGPGAKLISGAIFARYYLRDYQAKVEGV
jgi:hypothetical protein